MCWGCRLGRSAGDSSPPEVSVFSSVGSQAEKLVVAGNVNIQSCIFKEQQGDQSHSFGGK